MTGIDTCICILREAVPTRILILISMIDRLVFSLVVVVLHFCGVYPPGKGGERGKGIFTHGGLPLCQVCWLTLSPGAGAGFNSLRKF